MIALLIALVAIADPPSDHVLLAPIPADLRDGLDTAERALVVTEALAEAVSRLHNAWVQDGYLDSTPACDQEAPRSLAARSTAFGTAWRDAAELAATRSARLGLLPDAPTLAPLVTAADRDRLASVAERVDRQRRTYLEAAAWHARMLGPFVKKCAPTLAVARGIRRGEQRAADERPQATAVATAQPGRVCTPDGEIEATGVVVVLGDRACYSLGACDCEPVVVAPGAVLGPTTGTAGG